jgi:CelD/BcsL family acetyltransferase involved in cellulose biosynthesis
VLDAPGVAAFHRDASREFLARGWLRLYTLRIGGRIAAVYYGFLAKNRAYYYLGAFAPTFDAVSPGHLIVLHALTEAVREGARELDFLRGREPYKYGWGAEDRPQYRRRLRAH